MKRNARSPAAASGSRPIPTGSAMRALLAASAVAVVGCENPFTASDVTRDPTAEQHVAYEMASTVAAAAGAVLVPPPPAPIAKPSPSRWHGHVAGRMPISHWRRLSP